MAATIASQRATRREWAGLAVLALPTLLLSIDIFVLLLALPKIDLALHPSGTQQLWISDSCGFLLAGFLVTMGTPGASVDLVLGSAAPARAAAAVYRSRVGAAILPQLPSSAAGEARDTLAGATAAAQDVPHPASAALLHAARAAFTTGIGVVAVISALLLTGVALGVLVLLRHVARSAPEHPSGQAGHEAEHPSGVPGRSGVASPSRVSLGQAELTRRAE